MNKFTNRKRGVRTTAIHAGEAIDPVSRASSPNLVMSSTFAPTEVAGFSARNRQGYEGFVYARLSSPTVKQLEDKLAALEEAQSCQCYASGMAASSALMLGRLSQGDHLVISDTNYVGTAELVRDTLPRFGIEVTPVDMSDLDMVEGAIRPQTRMLWVETPVAVEVGDQTGLAVKGGHRLAGLERDDASRLIMQREGGREIGLPGRRDEAARTSYDRERKGHGEDQGLPASGHSASKGTRARLFGRPGTSLESVRTALCTDPAVDVTIALGGGLR